MFEIFKNLPPELATFLMAMLPITELRAAIPFAMGVFDLPVWEIYIWAVIGNLIPALILVWFLKPVSEWLMKHSRIFEKFFNWWFNKVTKKFEGKYIKYGEIALVLFVAIPLPITGAWTGSVASFLFKIPRKQAMLFITVGVLIAGVVVTAIASGAFALAKNSNI